MRDASTSIAFGSRAGAGVAAGAEAVAHTWRACAGARWVKETDCGTEKSQERRHAPLQNVQRGHGGPAGGGHSMRNHATARRCENIRHGIDRFTYELRILGVRISTSSTFQVDTRRR